MYERDLIWQDMGAVDPTYPLYPIASVLASAMLLLVLMTSFVRQSWNLGVAFLCFWLFLELLTAAVNAVVWADNADVRLYVYCDIVTRIQEITFVVKPMATLLIARRLHLIASLQSTELPTKAAKRRDLVIEWTLGLILPILVAGPIYYVNQGARFEVIEGSGCRVADAVSILQILVEESWTIIPPLISVTFYYPKVARTYYRQRRDIDSILSSTEPSGSRTNYFRILVLASIDLLITLPIGIVSVTLDIVESVSPPRMLFPFYPGWTILHADWEPPSFSYAEQLALGTAQNAEYHFTQWGSIVLAFTIFGLFGVTPEARASYWRIICTVGNWFGWKPVPRTQNGPTSLEGVGLDVARPQDKLDYDLEMGSRPPSFINTAALDANQGAGAGQTLDRREMRESESDLQSIKTMHHEEENEIASSEDLESHAAGTEVFETQGTGNFGPLAADGRAEIARGSATMPVFVPDRRGDIGKTFVNIQRAEPQDTDNRASHLMPASDDI